ncbi:hypothetical protein GIB67_042493, partial [Kingdonia uniflora]
GENSPTLSICYTPPILSPLHLNRHLTCPPSSSSLPLNSPSLPRGQNKNIYKKKLSLSPLNSLCLSHSLCTARFKFKFQWVFCPAICCRHSISY